MSLRLSYCAPDELVTLPIRVDGTNLHVNNKTTHSSLVFQVSFEWPLVYKDVVEWEQHNNKSGVFFHEENICENLFVVCSLVSRLVCNLNT